MTKSRFLYKGAPKANYKIFDLKEERYISTGQRSKSTWTSKAWVMAAATEYGKRISKDYAEKFLEIHVFPVESAIKIPFNEMTQETQKQPELVPVTDNYAALREFKKQYDIARSKNEMLCKYLGYIRNKFSYSEIFDAMKKAGFQTSVCEGIHKIMFYNVDDPDNWKFIETALKEKEKNLLNAI